MLCSNIFNRRHESTSWPKKLNFTGWLNKIKNVALNIDKICIFWPITKMHDHFIAEQCMYANFKPKRCIQMIDIQCTQVISTKCTIFWRWLMKQAMILKKIYKIQARHIISKMIDFFYGWSFKYMIISQQVIKINIFFLLARQI